MRRTRVASVVALLSASLLLSCADGDSPTGIEVQTFASMSIVPLFPSGGSASAVAGLPINVIQLTVLRVPGDVQVAQRVVSVNPNDAEWELNIEVPLSNESGVQYILEILLINETSGVRSVEWSARSAPVGLTAGAPSRIQQVEVARGPLDNLAVTSLVLSGPASTPEGTDFSISAAVQTNRATATPTVFWTSLDPTIASVNPDGTGRGLLPGVARIQADAGTLSTIHTLTVTAVPTAVSLTPATATATATGQDLTFVANVVDARGAPISGKAVTWDVGDTRILSDQGGGVFRTLAGGSTTVTATATAHPSLSATATVNVQIAPVSIQIPEGAQALSAVGQTRQLSVLGAGAGGSAVHGLTATWASSAPSVASVDASGLVTAIASGLAVITATVDTNAGATPTSASNASSTPSPAGEAGATLSAAADAGATPSPAPVAGATSTSAASSAAAVVLTAVVDVTVALPATTVTVIPGSATLAAVGASQGFTAQALDVNGVALANPTVTWASSNPAVVQVDATTGLATAVSAGTATITATVNGVSGGAQVTVSFPSGIAQIDILPNPASMVAFSTLQLSATALNFGGAVVATPFTWSSSDPAVATIDSQGLVTAVGLGVTTISATAAGITGTTALTVNPAQGGGGTFSYVTFGNTELVVGGATPLGVAKVVGSPDLLTHTGAGSIAPSAGSSTQGGSYVVGSAGEFRYTPPDGFIGTDDFPFVDVIGVTHQVDIQVNGPLIWYFDASASSGGDGTSSAPFDDLPGGTVGGVNDAIFLFSGTYSSGITLQTSQTLIGEPEGLDVFGSTVVPPGGTRPQIQTSSTGIQLADNTDVYQVDLLDGDPAIYGNGVQGVLVQDVAILASQYHGIELFNPTGALDFNRVSIENASKAGFFVSAGDAQIDVLLAAPGIDLNADEAVKVESTTGGYVNFSGANIHSPAGSEGFLIQSNAGDVFVNQPYTSTDPGNSGGLTVWNNSGDITFSSVAIDGTTGGAGIQADLNTGLFQVGGGSINIVDATGVDLANSNVDFSLSNLTVDNSASVTAARFLNLTGMVDIGLLQLDVTVANETALVVDNVTSFQITNSSSYIFAQNSQGLDLFNSNASVTLSNLVVLNSPSQGIHIDGMTGSFTTNQGSIQSSAFEGIQIDNSSSASFSFDTDVDDAGGFLFLAQGNINTAIDVTSNLTTTTGGGIYLDSNGGSSITFSGLLDLQTAGDDGFVATGGGQIEVSATAGNTVATTTGRPIEINGTAIGANGVTFESVSANGAGTGIFLFNAGTGPFTITGNGPVPSGGLIQNTIGNALDIVQAGPITIDHLRVQNANGHGLRVQTTPSLDVDDVVIVTGNVRNFLIQDVPGPTSITNSFITGSKHGNVYQLSAGTGTLTFDNNQMGSVATGTFGVPIDADLYLTITGTADVVSTITNSTFGIGSHVRHGVRAFASSNLDITVEGNSFNTTGQHGISLEAFSGGTIDGKIRNANVFTLTGKHGVNLLADGGTLYADVSQNSFVDSNWNGVEVETLGAGQLYGRVTDNTFTGSFGPLGAINGVLDGSGLAHLSVHGNIIDSQTDAGIYLETGNQGSSSTTDVQLNITNNNVTHTGTYFPIELIQGESSTVCSNVAGNMTAGGAPARVQMTQVATAVNNWQVERLNGGGGSETNGLFVRDHILYENPNAADADVVVQTAYDGVPQGSCSQPALPNGAQNGPPAAHPQSVMTDGSTPFGIILTGSDADGDALTFSIITPPSFGSLGTISPIGNNSASVTYTPSGVGSDPFTFQVDDGTGTISQAVVTPINPGPMAQNISYQTAGNTELVAGGQPAPSTAHILDASNIFAPTPSLTAVNTGPVATTLGGTATIFSDGSFTYDPPAGVTGMTDDFPIDAGPGGVATVDVQLLDMVWYVDNTAPGGGTGLSNAPFNQIGFVSGASGPGDIIYVHRGDGTATGQNQGISLKLNQKLFGEAYGLVTPNFGTLITGNANRPVIDHTVVGGAVTLAGGNEVRGLELWSTGGHEGIRASGINLAGTLVDDVIIQNAGRGIELVSTAGTMTVTNTHISGTTTAGIDIDTGNPQVMFGPTGSINTSAGIGLSVRNVTGALVTVDPVVLGTTGGDAVVIDNIASTVQVSNVSVMAGTNKGIEITNSAGGVTFNNIDIDGTTSAGINVDGGSVFTVIDFAGNSMSNSSGHLVHIANTVGGSVTINGAGIVDTGGEGIKISNSLSSSVFNAPVTITNPNSGLASAAVELNAAGGPVTFQDLTITGTDVKGISATASTSALTVGTGSISITNEPAIDITGHTLAMGFTSLSSIMSTGHGIQISNSTGTFSAAAGNVDASMAQAFYFQSNNALTFTFGGSATNNTGAATHFVYADSNTGSSGFNFNGPLIYNSSGGTGIYLNANATSAFTFAGDVNVSDYGDALYAYQGSVRILGSANSFSSGIGGPIVLSDLDGTSTIQNTTITSPSTDGIHVQQTTGTSTVNFFTNSIDQASGGGSGIYLDVSGTGNLTSTISGNTLDNNSVAGVYADAMGSSMLDLTVDASFGSNTMDGNQYGVHLAAGGTAVVTGLIASNLISNNTVGIGSDFGSTGAGLTASFSNNTITNSGADGMFIKGVGPGVGTYTIDNNTITNPNLTGIFARTGTGTGDASDGSFHIRNNAVEVPMYSDGISLGAEEAGTICGDFSGNVFTDLSFASAAIRVRQQTSTATFQLERLVGNPTVFATVEAQLLVDNPSDGGIGHRAALSTNFTGVTAGTCR